MKRRRKRGREGEAKEGEKRKRKSRRKKEEEGYQLANFISLNPVVVLAVPATQDSFH